MSDSDDNLDGTNADDSNGPKALRDQLKKLEKRIDDLSKENGDLRTFKRGVDLTSLLDKAGAPTRLAKYAARDIEDVSEDTVSAWLNENGQDFGWQPAGDAGDESDETADQARRISRATDMAPPTNPGSATDLLNKLKSQDIKTLVEQGHLPAELLAGR